MEQLKLTWEAIDNNDTVITEENNTYLDVEDALGNLRLFALLYSGEKVFEVDFKNKTVADRTTIIHTFSGDIDQSTFKFRRRHLVRYSLAEKKMLPDYISYVVKINDKEFVLKPDTEVSDKTDLKNLYVVEVK